jgi:hypothetical protein
MCLQLIDKKKNMKFFFAFFKSLKQAAGSGIGSGSKSQRYGSPDPHQNVTDTQHWSYFASL